MSLRVVLYMPFYSGSLEPRHARIHDVLHYLNVQHDLNFIYTVLAEKGRDKDSPRIRYGSIPFFTRYTQTYKKIPSKRSKESQSLKAKSGMPNPGPSSSPSIHHKPTSKKQLNTTPFSLSEAQPHHAFFLSCIQYIKKIARLPQQFFRRLKNYSEPNYMTRRICVFQLIIRCWLSPKPDVLHIVRPNQVSRMVERIFRKKNPGLRVIVGPNIMSYGELSATYDPKYFQQNHIESVLAVGSHHLQELAAFGVPEAKLVRLPPSVDRSVFYPEEAPSPSPKRESLCILFAASQLAVEKGTNTFLEAMRFLKQDGRVAFSVLIAGSEELIPGVQTPFDRSLLKGLEGELQMLGRVPREKMAELYRRADVFVHTSRLEAGPTTTIESLSCGTPCIVPDHPSFKEPELMKGLRFFEGDDPEALQECLVKFYGDWKAGQTQSGFIPAVDETDTSRFLEELYLGERRA